MGKTSLFLFFSGSRRSHQYVLKMFVKMLPPLGKDESGCGTVAVLWVAQEECQAVVEGIVPRSLHRALQPCCTSDAQC